MWYVFRMRWRRYCCSISLSHSSFFGVGCIILISNISNTILGKHMNVKIFKMLMIYMNICQRVGRLYIISLRQTCEFMYRDSTWISNTRWHTICFWTLATKIFVFLFFIKLDCFYCVRKEIMKIVQPGSFVMLKCEKCKMKLYIWFDSFKAVKHLVSV